MKLFEEGGVPGPYHLGLDGPQVRAAPAGELLGVVKSRSDLGKELSLLYFKKGMRNSCAMGLALASAGKDGLAFSSAPRINGREGVELDAAAGA